MTTMIPLSQRSAIEKLVITLDNMAGMADSFYDALTYSEAVAIADVLLAHGEGKAAGRFMRDWSQSDGNAEDAEEFAEDLASWLALLTAIDAEPEPAPTEGWGVMRPGDRRFHYYRTGLSLCGRVGFYRGELEAEDGSRATHECAACLRRVILEAARRPSAEGAGNE